MVLREIARVPMSVFDEYRALCFKQPRAMNFWMMNMGFIAVLFLGKGVEKLAIKGSAADKYETARRARRFFIPYFLAGYKFRFPKN